MSEFAPTMTVGNDILDIGSRKARRQRGDPMAPDAAMLTGTPAQFDIPNVTNVRDLYKLMIYEVHVDPYNVGCTISNIDSHYSLSLVSKRLLNDCVP